MIVRPALRALVPLLVALLAGCASDDDTYYPLAAERWWYYDISEVVLDEPRSGRYIVMNAGPGTIAGQAVFLQAAQSGTMEYLRPYGAGVERIAHRRPDTRGVRQDDPPRIVLPETIETGATWAVPSTLGLIESRTFARGDRVIVRRVPVVLEKTIAARDLEVTVASGRYDDCILVEGSGHAFVATDRGNSEATVVVETKEWFARGVGLVKLERTERSDSPFLKTGTQRWELADRGD